MKNAACGNNSALVKAVLKDQELKDLILMEMINEIKKEIRLYSKDPACLLKLKSPADFQMHHSTSNYWLSAQNWLFFFLVYLSLET